MRPYVLVALFIASGITLLLFARVCFRDFPRLGEQ